MQNSGANFGLWLSIVLNCFMAAVGHPASLVAAIVSGIPCRKESVSEAGRMSSMYDTPSCSHSQRLFFVRYHFRNKGPVGLSLSLYVNSPTRRKAAKARVNAARMTIW